jgi:F0F1-type ATP synthase membrane subunit b/b'
VQDQEGLIAVGHENDEAVAAGEDVRADYVADRIAAILDAAEQAAASMRQEAEEVLERRRDEAERQADLLIAEAEREAERVVERAQAEAEAMVAEQVAQARELARTLVVRATELLRRLEDAETVKESVEGLLGDLDDMTARMPAPPVADEPEPEPEPVEREPEANGGAPDAEAPPRERQSGLEPIEEARLMALQMAMSGRTRAEVESDLRHGLHVEDPETVLDDVFGKGTPGSQRIPWSGLAKGEAP